MKETELKVREEFFGVPAFVALTAAEQAKIYGLQATYYFQVRNRGAARKWYLQAIRVSPLTMPRAYLLFAMTLVNEQVFEMGIRLRRRLRGIANTSNK